MKQDKFKTNKFAKEYKEELKKEGATGDRWTDESFKGPTGTCLNDILENAKDIKENLKYDKTMDFPRIYTLSVGLFFGLVLAMIYATPAIIEACK